MEVAIYEIRVARKRQKFKKSCPQMILAVVFVAHKKAHQPLSIDYWAFYVLWF
jgi:hypothetical protein